jgi:hypothetical protein
MLVLREVLKKVKGLSNEHRHFIERIERRGPRPEDCLTYANIGSIGPDILYYSVDTVKAMVFDTYRRGRGVDAWAYHPHSNRPNELPLKWIEIIFRDALRSNGKVLLKIEDYKRIAFVAGYLTHIAADQTIHPLVNDISGPYYRSGENRKEHRYCEECQDYCLYEALRNQVNDPPFAATKFGEWVNFTRGKVMPLWTIMLTGLDRLRIYVPMLGSVRIGRLARFLRTFERTESSMVCYIQRGFAEVYGSRPSFREIVECMSNVMLVLSLTQRISVYKKMTREIKLGRAPEDTSYGRKYFRDFPHMQRFRDAVDLGVIYLCALFEALVVLKENVSFSDEYANRFKRIVSAVDLSCPLETDFIGTAKKSFGDISSTIPLKLRQSIRRAFVEGRWRGELAKYYNYPDDSGWQ